MREVLSFRDGEEKHSEKSQIQRGDFESRKENHSNVTSRCLCLFTKLGKTHTLRFFGLAKFSQTLFLCLKVGKNILPGYVQPPLMNITFV